MIPFFEEQGIPLQRVLTDRGTEYCGNPEHHEYELYSASRTSTTPEPRRGARRPTVSASAFVKTVLDEFYRIAFRKRIYTTIEQLQGDLDAWMTG